MSPGDIKSRSSALALFVNAISKKTKSRQASHYQDKRVFRTISPLRPWENESSPTKTTSRKHSYSFKQGLYFKDTKRNSKKENEKFLSFSFKQNNSTCKEQSEKNKLFLESDFIHHSDISAYIEEYRAARHRLSESEKTQGSKEVQKAYHSLGISKRLKQSSPIEIRFSEESCGDGRAISKTDFQDRSTLDEGDRLDEEETEERDENADNSIPRCAGDNDLHRISSHVTKLPSLSSDVEQQHSNSSILNLANNTAQCKYRIADEILDLSQTRYRLASFNRTILNNSGQRERNKQRYRRIELPKVTVKRETSETAEKKTKKTRENRVKLAKSIAKNTIISLPSTLVGPCSHKLPGLNDSRPTAVPRGSKEHCEVTASMMNETSSPNVSAVPSTENTSPNDSKTIFAPHRSRSVRDMIIASVKELHPFSENKTPEIKTIPEIVEKKEPLNTERSFSDPENPKQSISLRIYQNLMYKPSMRKFVEELYTPRKKTRSRDADSYVLAGKPIQKLPPVKTHYQHPHVVNKSIYRKRLHRKKLLEGLEQQRSTMSMNDCDLLQAREKSEFFKHEVALNLHSKSMVTLAIIPKIQTVTKSQIFLKNAAY